MLPEATDFSLYGWVSNRRKVVACEQVKRPPPGEVQLRSESLGCGVRYFVESCFGLHWTRILVFEGGSLILTRCLPTIKDRYRFDRRLNNARHMVLRHSRIVEAAMFSK